MFLELFPPAVRLLGGFVPAALCLSLTLALPAAAALDTDPPNSHDAYYCTECHDRDPVEGVDTWRTVGFYNGDDGIVDLCDRCHDETENVHPVHVHPSAARSPVLVPPFLPLETRGEFKGTVVCSSCHAMHASTAAYGLLRGLPESTRPEDISRARFPNRGKLCGSCHGSYLEVMSPHEWSQDSRKGCPFCHAVEPWEGGPARSAGGPDELCNMCHGNLSERHYYRLDPFSDADLAAEVPDSGLPLHQEEAICISCHDPHGRTGLGAFIRPDYVQFTLKSTRVKPHFRHFLCEACHSVMPAAPPGNPGAPSLAEVPLKSEDPSFLCNRCHEAGAAKSHAHPVREVPPEFLPQIPQDWPLYENKVTCLTCHAPGDAPRQDPANPHFLRDGPYAVRNSICWKCHDRGKLAKLNPHQQIHLGKECELCHVTKPSLEVPPEEQEITFRADILLLCIRCHDDPYHPGGHDHNGPPDREFMAAKGISISEEMPLDRFGQITCATCHNPHADGEQRKLNVGREICGNCHTY